MAVLRMVFLLLAVGSGCVALWATVAGAPPLGQLWFSVDAPSLNLTQALIQRYLHPAVWDTVVVPLLVQPSALVAFATAALAALAAAVTARFARRRR
ncbi:MAG: hypothetical protein AAFX81_03200 [Pseudomonadota bacterium]